MKENEIAVNQYSHIFKSYFPFGLRIFLTLLFVGDIGKIIARGFNGFESILWLFWIYVFFSKKAVAIRFENNTYFEGSTLFGIKFGGYNPLPAIEYISVFTANMVSNVYTTPTTQGQIRTETIQVNLIHSRNQRLTIFETDNKDIALNMAKYFSMKLKLKILDATTRDFVWVDGYPE